MFVSTIRLTHNLALPTIRVQLKNDVANQNFVLE